MTDSKLINARAMLPLKIDPRSGNTQIFVSVIIKEARENFGRIDVRVTPLMGSGFAWVRLASLKGVQYEETVETLDTDIARQSTSANGPGYRKARRKDASTPQGITDPRTGVTYKTEGA
jgi:hypothetical protein